MNQTHGHGFGLASVCVFIILPSVVSSFSFVVSFLNVCSLDTATLRHVVGISLQECVSECVQRVSCEYIGYQRHCQSCKLFGHLDLAKVPQTGGGCVLVKRSDATLPTSTDVCNCNDGQVCQDGSCDIRECPRPIITNGTIVGNMLAVRSTLKIVCDQNFTEINNETSTTCRASGNWSYNANCVSTIDCNDISFDNGQLLGLANGVGAVRTIICNSAFEEKLGETAVKCEASGHWNYTPVCITVCSSDEAFSSGDLSVKIFHSHKDRNKFDDALDYCITDGGKLVKIDEQWKMEFIGQILLSCSAFSSHSYWTDGRGYDGSWLFSDNSSVPMDARFWHDGGPDGGNSCPRLSEEDGHVLWNDKNCNIKERFICEY